MYYARRKQIVNLMNGQTQISEQKKSLPCSTDK